MAVDPMASSWAKYHWANRHMKTVEDAIAHAFDPDVHSIPLDVDVQESGNLAHAHVRIGGLPLVQANINLALGDVLQNFRAALDHLAWSLVKLGSDPRPREPNLIYFPMCQSGGSFSYWVGRRLPGVSDDHRKVIRRYQPYRSGERAKAIRWLRNLSDIDKHRALVVTPINSAPRFQMRVSASWPILHYEDLMRQNRPLKVGTPILHLRLVRPGPHKCHVQVDGSFSIYPSLGRGVPIAHALGLIDATVFEILSTFDALL